MDIFANEITAVNPPQPVAPYMVSKYTKSYLEALKGGQEDIVTKVNAQNAVVKSYVESEALRLDNKIDALQGEANLSFTDATNDRNAIRSDVEELKLWRANNTDELAQEVDKAINEKVNQTAYDAVVEQLNNKDSELTASLSQAITDRQNKDAEHTALLQRMEKFANLVLSLNDLEDGNGNVIASFDDVVVEQGEAPAPAPAPAPSGDKPSFTISSLSSSYFSPADASHIVGVMLDWGAPETAPAGVTLYEMDFGDFIQYKLDTNIGGIGMTFNFPDEPVTSGTRDIDGDYDTTGPNFEYKTPLASVTVA